MRMCYLDSLNILNATRSLLLNSWGGFESFLSYLETNSCKAIILFNYVQKQDAFWS